MIMKVGSWNVRTMLQAGKMAEIADELLKYDLDITALQEIRWKSYGRIRKPRYTFLYSGAEKKGERGVGFIIERSLESISPSSGALDVELQHTVFCTEFLDGWWSSEPLRRSCLRCGWCRAPSAT